MSGRRNRSGSNRSDRRYQEPPSNRSQESIEMSRGPSREQLMPNVPPPLNLAYDPRTDPRAQYRDPRMEQQHPGQHRVRINDDVDEFGFSPSGSSANLTPAGTPRVVRKKTTRKIELYRGNLVLNCPVADVLQNNFVQNRTDEEYNVMRYSAVTCKVPDAFMFRNFTLRPQLYGRQTELFICVTLYNEDPLLVSRSLYAIVKNIQYLCSRERSAIWGPDGWRKVVVCIVADGRSKVNKDTLKLLGLMGLYQEGIMKDHVSTPQAQEQRSRSGTYDSSTARSVEDAGKVHAHLFEYNCLSVVDETGKLRETKVPIQMMFLLKEENKKKLNSHRWFFNGMAPILNPNVCILIDAGTKPSPSSFYHLYKCFQNNANVAGACGEIVADLGRGCVKVLNPLVGAQNFEYKMSNILDKPLESVFGFISVLPGAFCAYRYVALQNDQNGDGPLNEYFKGEKLHEGANQNIFLANAYLAEDRILCFELVAKKHSNWILRYVKAASATTDVPEEASEFIGQRRRWINGSFFAMLVAMAGWYRIWNTRHSFTQKLLFQLQFFYNIITALLSWFGIALFYMTFYYLSENAVSANPDPLNGASGIVWAIIRQIYIATIVVIVIASMGNRPQGAKGIYLFAIIVFSIIMILMVVLTGFTIGTGISSAIQAERTANPGISSGQAFTNALKTPAFLNIFITVVSTYGLYLLISILHADPWHMFTSFLQYTFLLPTFINILPIYSFTNISDLSWGTKSSGGPAKLGGAKTMKDEDKNNVEVELPFANQQDKGSLNADYENWMTFFQTPANMSRVEVQKRNLQTKTEDWYKTFRTRTVLLWLLTNALLIAILTSGQLSKALGGVNTSQPFLAFVFWTFLGLTGVRVVGSCIYLLQYYAIRCCC